MAQLSIRKVMVCLLTICVTLGLNLPAVEAIAAPMQSSTMVNMDMSSMATKGMSDSGSKSGCPHCPDMGGMPSMNCGLPCPPLASGDSQFEFKQAEPAMSIYLISELALTGYNLAPETGPPRTLTHV